MAASWRSPKEIRDRLRAEYAGREVDGWSCNCGCIKVGASVVVDVQYYTDESGAVWRWVLGLEDASGHKWQTDAGSLFPDWDARLSAATAEVHSMRLTYSMAWAAAADAANTRMRAAGRAKWSRDDYNFAVETFDRLWPQRQDYDIPIADVWPKTDERVEVPSETLAASQAFEGKRRPS